MPLLQSLLDDIQHADSSGMFGRMRRSLTASRLQIVTAIGKIEALVVQRKIGDLLIARAIISPTQLWNDGSTTL